METTFSICIPNYNYEKYLGETLESVVSQTFRDYEIVIADNASTDKSIEIIQSFAQQHTNIKYKVNSANVGFAGNLDKSAEMAKADWMVMLSSDDLMTPEALSTYHAFIEIASVKYGSEIAFCSAFDKIDGNGEYLEYIGPSNRIWKQEDIDSELSSLMNCTVYKLEAEVALNRCLTYFYNPFNFAATCYHHSLYKKVEGYGGSRIINPDKWFHWRIITESKYIFYIDKPLFKYRWHNTNQTSQQSQSGALKFWVDEYRSSFEITPFMLKKARLSNEEIKHHFINRTILPYAFKYIKTGERILATRILFFGMATYLNICVKNKRTYLIITLLLLGPIGTVIAKLTNR